jgi:hypothetical protein
MPPGLANNAPPVTSSLLCCLAGVLLFTASGLALDGTAAPTSPNMQLISPGVYQIGAIRIDQAQRTATFPGKVNMVLGAIEYLLVTTHGQTHESLLNTEVQPADLHFSMLLLGAKGAGITTPSEADAPPAQIDKEFLAHAPQLTGDSIQISVKWKAETGEKTAPVEDWITNTDTAKPASRGPWLYTGSMFRSGHFLAQTEGAFASMVTYPAALINNPRKGNDNDQIWMVNHEAVPPAETPVEIVIKLEEIPAIPAP